MTDFADMGPLILPFVRECSLPAAMVAARFATIEFCERTLWHQMQLEPIDILAGQATYEVEVPPDTVLEQIMSLQLADGLRPLEPRTQDWLDIYRPGWKTAEGTPTDYTQIDKDDVQLVASPITAQAGGLLIRVALKPAANTTVFDDSLFQHHSETLAYGARMRLVETAGQPYYAPDQAPDLRRRFYGAVSRARVARFGDHTRAPQHVQMRPFV